jgi:membrane fusion protein (multidrug efflux system)
MTPWWQRKRVKLLFASVIIFLIFVVMLWWLFFRSYISTNDARITTNILRVAPVGVGGRVEKVFVEEGSLVTIGELLVEIDHRVPAAQYQKAQARFELTKLELDRMNKLAKGGYSAVKELDNAKTNYDIAEADLKLAEVTLQNTYLKSPIDGVVIQKLAQQGNLLEPGQVAVIISDVDNAWVSANIEETKVSQLKMGQPVTITIDEGGTLTGKVEEINAATASQFSLLPAENASGNYTKVVQKIPVKIVLDPHPAHKILRAGQSVSIKIRVR